MSNLINLQRLRKVMPLINHRFVSSTSNRNNSESVSTTTNNPSSVTTNNPFVIDEKTKRTDRNWIYYGFDINNKDNDRRAMHQVMFVTVTLCLVGGAYYFAYVPDVNLKDWTIREAFLEIRRREAQGLPLIDANLVDPSKFDLPSDEELGDTPVII